MTSAMETKKVIKGGSFILEDHDSSEVFTPDDLSDEHLMIAQTAREFTEKEIIPLDAEIASKDYELTRGLLRKAGELGLLSIDIPEKYGGAGLDLLSSLVASEAMSGQASFSGSLGAHTTIGTLPIVYFGTDEQKKKYLPRLATAELVGAYALTESGSGSDALGAKTRAVLSEDGKHYVLNGQKMWITNAGFADVFIVFAKVDGEKFTAFIVERSFPGVSIAPEEHKMGLQGSSTCAVNLEEAQVPVENVLGEIGKGHKIAFNILNIGRLKLGVSAIAGSKRLTSIAIDYAKQRYQFGVPISSFGLIKHKLAEMAIRTYVADSMTYRTVGMIEDALFTIDRDSPADMLKAIEDYAVECSIIKVVGSETLDYVSDEAVQVFGGNGYSKDYPVERAYRDSRISRIYEGTNEINRIVIGSQLLRRATAGELALFDAADNTLVHGLGRGATLNMTRANLAFSEELLLVKAAKAMTLASLEAANRVFGDTVRNEQEVIALIANMVMDVFAMESALLRTQRMLADRGVEQCAVQADITRVFARDAVSRVEQSARAVASEIEDAKCAAAIAEFAHHSPMKSVAARRRIADAVIQAGRYFVG